MVSDHDTSPDHRFAAAAAAELATVSGPPDVTQRIGLVHAYREAGLPGPAEAELMRMLRMFPGDGTVLAALLEMAIEQRRIPALMRLIRAGVQIPDPPLDLRRAIARALTTLGRFDQAAGQYARLVATEQGRALAASDVARFVLAHPDVPQLVSALAGLADVDQLEPQPIRYAVFRTLVEVDRRRATELLGRLDLREMTGHEFLTDVAVQSWRLGQWKIALRAAARATRVAGDSEVARRLGVSARSFAGRLGDALRAARRLTAHPPLAADSGLLAALRELATEAETVGKPRFAVLAPAGNGRPWRAVRHEDPEPSPIAARLLEERQDAVSASVVPGDCADTGPWEVLAEASLVRPHVMVQAVRPVPILHAFVPVAANDTWAWQEVPFAAAEIAEDLAAAFRWMALDRAAPAPSPLRMSPLWQQVEHELRFTRTEKE